MQQYAKLKNGDLAIIDNVNEDVKGLHSDKVMASINGGEFQPLSKNKIEEAGSHPFN